MNGGMAVLPICVMLALIAYSRSRSGAVPTLRERLRVGLVAMAVVWPAIVFGTRPKNAPLPPNADEWFALVFGVSLGAIPLVAYLLIDYSLRLTRRLESRYRATRTV